MKKKSCPEWRADSEQGILEALLAGSQVFIHYEYDKLI